jgi:pimeloyl-ACP methyl ester carboxylesterase
VGQSLGGGVAMQFAHQHPDYCERLVLISSGGLGAEVGWTLRLLAAPGAELVLPAIAPPAVVTFGDRMRSRLAPLGIRNPRAGETWSAYASLSHRPSRAAFLRTLRSVVDHRGQAVSAFSRLPYAAGLPTLLIWGDHDRIIPVDHARAAHDAIAGSRLVILPGVGHYPHLEAVEPVMAALDDFIATTTPWQWRRLTKSSSVTDTARC